MTINEAKKNLTAHLLGLGVTYTKLSAKSVSFIDLARVVRVFVTVHGAKFPVGVDEWTVRNSFHGKPGYLIQWKKF